MVVSTQRLLVCCFLAAAAAEVDLEDTCLSSECEEGVHLLQKKATAQSQLQGGLADQKLCHLCGYVPNANIGYTGKETVTFVGKSKDGAQKCCDQCKAKAVGPEPCAAWVYIHDGHCYQKYDIGNPVELIESPDRSGSDAGILSLPCKDCGFVPNANIGWTGKETVTFVGTGKGDAQKCCDQCKEKAVGNEPCVAWVYIHDGHCYQKYDTGRHVELIASPDKSGSDAGILKPAPTCLDCGYVANANIGWTGKETVTFVGISTDAGQRCCDECKAKVGADPPCAAWVYIHDGHCYQKYDIGSPVELIESPDSSGSDAGILTVAPAPACLDCGYVPNANVGWTGKESVTFVGKGVGAGQKCCDECKAKVSASPPCAAWVYIHDGHCYQKYDIGMPVELIESPDRSGSDAGILK